MTVSHLLPWLLLIVVLKMIEPFIKRSRISSRRNSARQAIRRSTSSTASSSAAHSGWLGELKTRFILWFFLRNGAYRRLHNVIIPGASGTAQIDHIIVSPFGIFVLETKNHKGWIFVDEKQPQWTQNIYGSRYSFQNPLRQNYRHTQSLSQFLELDADLFHSVVYFAGDCTFKTPMPRNVLSRGLITYIRSFTLPRLTSQQIARVFEQLTHIKKQPAATNSQHVHALNARFASTTICPKCSGELVQRKIRTGSNAENIFLGCANYPRCRFTRDC